MIVLSISREESVIRDLFCNGADGYVLKDGPTRHLFEAISYVLDGGQYLTPLLRRESIENQKEKRDPVALLSKREYEVFSFLVDGMRPKDIAKILDISPKTVTLIAPTLCGNSTSRVSRGSFVLRSSATSTSAHCPVFSIAGGRQCRLPPRHSFSDRRNQRIERIFPFVQVGKLGLIAVLPSRTRILLSGADDDV